MERRSTPASYERWVYVKDGAAFRANAFGALTGNAFILVMIVVVFAAAVFATFAHPLAGLLIGICGVGLALAMPRYGRWTGNCPHCDRTIYVPEAGPFNCPACERRVILEDGVFVAV